MNNLTKLNVKSTEPSITGGSFFTLGNVGFWPEAALHIAENIAWRPSAMRRKADGQPTVWR